MLIEFVNLTNGMACVRNGHANPNLYRVCRIQSSQCESGAWERVLRSVPDEMLFWAVQGNLIMVHDRSERNRETRACWQGLELARIFAENLWLGRHWPGEGRGTEHGMYQYFTTTVMPGLSRDIRTRFLYYRRWRTPALKRVRMTSCWRADETQEIPKLKAIQNTLSI